MKHFDVKCSWLYNSSHFPGQRTLLLCPDPAEGTAQCSLHHIDISCYSMIPITDQIWLLKTAFASACDVDDFSECLAAPLIWVIKEFFRRLCRRIIACGPFINLSPFILKLSLENRETNKWPSGEVCPMLPCTVLILLPDATSADQLFRRFYCTQYLRIISEN